MSEELTPNAFIGRTIAPADEDLTAALGSTRSLWDEALATLAGRFGLAEWEWTSYSPKAGWSVRIKKGKRNILYMTPCRNCFRVAFVLGGKAVQAAQQSNTPARVRKMIAAGMQYPEGLGIRWDIKSSKDLAPIESLTALKLAH